MTTYIACYGTLMKDFPTQDELDIAEKLKFVDTAYLPGALYELGDFPGMVKSENEETYAEIYEILDDQALKVMDLYEDYDPKHPQTSLYIREAVTLTSPALTCWAYYYMGGLNGRKKIKENNWIEYFRKKYGIHPEDL